MWGRGLFQRKDSGFQSAHENVGIGRCHLCTHGCALFLDVKLIIKSENVVVENGFYVFNEFLCIFYVGGE